MRVLIVEDDRSTAEAIMLDLATVGIDCNVAEHGKNGLEIIELGKQTYDLVILDLLLPDMHGYDVLKALKAAKIKTPVLILSAMSDVEEKVRGLGLGADDYLTKPFSMNELIARVNALVRRSKGHAESVLKIDGLRIDLDTRTVEFNGKPVHLTHKEYAVLECLAMHRGVVVSKDKLADHVYQNATEARDIRILDVFVCKLRQKLYAASGKNYIETRWGSGYLLPDLINNQTAPVSSPVNVCAELVED